MTNVEFFFDLSSPWTRLAFHNIQPIVAQTGATIEWKPFLVGGVFNAVNSSVYDGRANPDNPKFRHTYKWLKAWSRLAGLPMNFPSEHHPVKSVNAMRVCCALQQDQDALFRFASKAFDAYFALQQNLDDPEVLQTIANECALSGAELIAKSSSPEIKAALRDNTQEVIDRGGFGSPTIFVDKKELYFGNDQLPLVHQALATAR